MELAVRTAGVAPSALVDPIRSAMAALDPAEALRAE